MKLEHGKRYVMRNGEVTPPVCDMRPHGKSSGQPFTAYIDCISRHWRDDGCFWASGGESDYDLVAEYVEPQPPKWVPFDDAEMSSLMGRSVRLKNWQLKLAAMVTMVSATSVRFDHYSMDADTLFDQCEFADGTPCGKRVEP